MSQYERFLVNFNRDVLHRYRLHPDRYRLEEDRMGGRVLAIGPAMPFQEIRYGLRRLADGSTCVAVFCLHLGRLAPEERSHWESDYLRSPAFAKEDPEFDAWVARYLEGSWGIPDGPIKQILREVALLSALTKEAVGVSLFREVDNALLGLPAAENTECLKRAYEQLSCLVLDGLEKKAIEALAGRLGTCLTDSSKTLNSLRELLPPELVEMVHKPLRTVRDERARVHGVQQAVPCSARAEFERAATDVAGALQALRRWLEEVLEFDSELCMGRQSVGRMLFPAFSGPCRPAEKLEALKGAQGKTIESVEFGEEEPQDECHESEAIVLRFTDGSALAIRVGSNAQNLAWEHAAIRPGDVHTDLMVFWQPSARRRPSRSPTPPGT